MIKAETLVKNRYVVAFDKGIKGEYSITTDSRDITAADAFVALDGENFRGIQFVENCLQAGVELVIVKKDQESEAILKKLLSVGYIFSVIYTEDAISYLQELAKVFLDLWKRENAGTVIGITGSNGKTTSKEMLYHIIDTIAPGKVWRTHKNFNNHIGVPLTILALQPQHKFAIVEMGTNHPGELRVLCDICPLDAGFITNIGESHLEFFHDREGVFKEKRVVYDAICKSNGYFVVNRDDVHLKNLKGTSYGETGEDVKFVFRESGFELKEKGKTWTFSNPRIKGKHNYFNMGMCASLGMLLFSDDKASVVKAVNSFVPSDPNRANWARIEERDIFLDAYNANPSSMMASLEFFVGQIEEDGHALFILGDMNELGIRAGEFHRKVGEFLSWQAVKKEVVFIGYYADQYNEGFGGGATCYETLSDFQEDWPKLYRKHKKFFIKGSRSLQLESLIDIKER